MKQVLQIHKTGRTEVANLPIPAVKPGHLLIRTNISLISSGTERMLIESGRKNILQQVLAQPEKIKKAIDRVHSEGVLNTFDSIKTRADQVQPLGYCNVGEVIEVGSHVVEYKVGDRVVSNGAHAEFVCVPKNLCAKVPSGVSDEEAVFTVLGAIALQGVRLLNPTIGESFAVMGLGTIGLLTVQLLRANGCSVVAMDMAEERLKLAESFGAQTINLSKTNDSIRAAMNFTGGRGVDGVVIAAATTSNEPLHVSASICRRRGRIVLTGVIGPELSRADFFEKEITFQVSCSYGPGRYDPLYEQQGVDYPIGFVRWTEQRNFEAFLDLVQAKKISGRELISHRFPIAQAEDAYALLKQNSGNIAIALTYLHPPPPQNSPRHVQVVNSSVMAEPILSFVGAGNYGGQVLLPAFKHTGAGIHSIADRGGLMSWIAARKSDAAEASTDISRVIADPLANALVIATRHDTHADFTCQALRAGKHVFVEKPLAINEDQLKQIETCYAPLAQTQLLMVGFNRRFAPHVVKVKEYLVQRQEPLVMVMTINAGRIPKDHWVHDPLAGGGRIIGEGCHFVDLMRFFAGSPISDIQTQSVGRSADGMRADKVAVIISFEDGSMGTLNYLANGHTSYPKEHIEVFCAGSIYRLENFKRLRVFGHRMFKGGSLWRQDKGQNACAQAFIRAIRQGAPSPIPFSELAEVTRATFKIATQIR